MSGYAMFRMPHASHAVRLIQSSGEPEEIATSASLGDKSGFVFAPFARSGRCPMLLIKPDSAERVIIPDSGNDPITSSPCRHEDASERGRYSKDFALFHSKLLSSEFEKIVLSRSTTVTKSQRQPPEELFLRACRLYPRLFVALVSTSRGGTWLMATPEILLSGSGNEYSTMALAGSMRLNDDQLGFDTPHDGNSVPALLWSGKNKHEQALVASYIDERLRRFSDNVTQSLPYTVRAGRMVHLRSDFRFRIGSADSLGEVIDSLHPTPAVCGIPKEKTFSYILNNESCDRKYYSGFCGLLSFGGETRLFVSLRCMEITPQGYVLYAGGGLLPESDEAREWQETEDKMDTMRAVLQSADGSI